MLRALALNIIFAAVLSCVGCNPFDDGSEDGGRVRDAELAAIEAVAERFGSAVISGDVEGFAELFTEDATYAANNGQFLGGREEILAAAAEWFQVPMKPTSRTLRAKVQGQLAYVVQEYSNEVRLPNGHTLTITGKSLGVFRRESDGRWKIEALVVNRDPEGK